MTYMRYNNENSLNKYSRPRFAGDTEHVVGAKFIFLAFCLSGARTTVRWQNESGVAPASPTDSHDRNRFPSRSERNEFGPYNFVHSQNIWIAESRLIHQAQDAISSLLIQPTLLSQLASLRLDARKNRVPTGIFTILFCILLSIIFMPTAHADGGAPNLAYVSGTGKGVSVIDVAQQKITQTISASSNSHMILLSTDARFLFVTEPQQGRLRIVAAKTGDTICTANIAGQPTLLAIDATSNTLYVAGNGAASVIALDPTNCNVKHVFQTTGNVYGLAVAAVASSIGGSTGDQLWVADDQLQVFDTVSFQQISTVTISGQPHYVSIPAGATVYVTTRTGDVMAIDLSSHKVLPLISGGTYGPMDYDATTGEVYVPDMKNNQLVVLAPVNSGFSPPHEPSRILHLNATPQSIAITSDGQLGFAALSNGSVVMIDVPGRQVANTFSVGGDPQFVITGLYPPVLGTTPQQATIYGTILNIAAYIFVVALFIVPIILFRRYSKAAKKQ